MSQGPTNGRRLWIREGVSRLTSAGIALSCGALLGVARWLEPAAEGHGTHLQLGLNPCTFLDWTGWPCPMCGATTTFSYMADFHWIAGLVNQPFAAILFVTTVFLAVLATLEAARPAGRWIRLREWVQPLEGRIAFLLLALMALSWVYKITIMPQLSAG